MAYVMMAVPAEIVPAVTEFIERQRLQPSTEPLAPNGFVHGWDGETVRRAYRDSADAMRNVLEFLARKPDEEVSSEQIAEAINAERGWNTVAGMLGAFGRRCANRYKKPEPMWEYRWDEGRIRLTMPAGAAEVIRDAAGI